MTVLRIILGLWFITAFYPIYVFSTAADLTPQEHLSKIVVGLVILGLSVLSLISAGLGHCTLFVGSFLMAIYLVIDLFVTMARLSED